MTKVEYIPLQLVEAIDVNYDRMVADLKRAAQIKANETGKIQRVKVSRPGDESECTTIILPDEMNRKLVTGLTHMGACR